MGAGAKRRLTDVVCAGLAALGAAVACAGAADAATMVYPPAGGSFDSDVQGWTASGASCGATSGAVLCSAAGSYDGAGGNPGGALGVDVDVTLNALGLFAGTATWSSPAFALPPGGTVTGGSFAFDAALASGGLASLGLTGDVAATLEDLTATTTLTLPGIVLDGRSAAFATASGAVPAGALVPGHSYRLVLRATTGSSATSLGVLGSARTRVDNVALAVTRAEASADGAGDDGVAGGGSAGAGGAGGGSTSVGGTVTTVRSDARGAGARRGRCTIVGTPRADRLVGTRWRDVICGLGGNDVLIGRGRGDTLIGGRGRDVLAGGPGRDVLRGGSGNDLLRGGGGDDALFGLTGRDVLAGGPGRDMLRGGSGGDRLLGGAGRDVARGALRHDRVVGVEHRRR